MVVGKYLTQWNLGWLKFNRVILISNCNWEKILEYDDQHFTKPPTDAIPTRRMNFHPLRKTFSVILKLLITYSRRERGELVLDSDPQKSQQVQFTF